jgi:bacterial/archaeal transporter family protein
MNWLIYAFIAAAIFGFQDIISKIVLSKEHSNEFLTILYLSGLIFLLPFFKHIIVPDATSMLLIIIRSVTLAGAYMLFIKALKHMDISEVSPLTNLRLLIIFLYGFVFLSEVIKWMQLLGAFVLMFGSYILESEGHIKNLHKTLIKVTKNKYVFYIIIYIILIPMTSIFSKLIVNRGVNSFNLLFFHYVISTFIYLGITFLVYGGIKDLIEGFKLGGMWIIVRSISGLIVQFIYFLAYADPVSLVSVIVPITQLKTLISTIFGGALLHEKHLSSKIIGCVLMVIGVVFIII